MRKSLLAFCLVFTSLAQATPAVAPVVDTTEMPEPTALQLFSAESMREFRAEKAALAALARTELRVISGSVKGDEAHYVVASTRTRCAYDLAYLELPEEDGSLVGLWMVNKSNCKPLKGGR